VDPLEGLINLLGAATAAVCTVLLYRGYWRTGARLLWWSAVCFLALATENAILFFDKNPNFVVPATPETLVLVRQAIATFGIVCLIYSLVWETER
jgi:hypothetical protein